MCTLSTVVNTLPEDICNYRTTALTLIPSKLILQYYDQKKPAFTQGAEQEILNIRQIIEKSKKFNVPTCSFFITLKCFIAYDGKIYAIVINKWSARDLILL